MNSRDHSRDQPTLAFLLKVNGREILQYLTGAELYRLRNVLPIDDLNQMLIHVTLSEIQDRFKLLFNLLSDQKTNYQEFITVLQQCQVVISGSFLVQSALGEYWKNSDIDLYVPEEKYYILRSYLSKYFSITRIFNESTRIMADEDYSYHDQISQVEEFKIGAYYNVLFNLEQEGRIKKRDLSLVEYDYQHRQLNRKTYAYWDQLTIQTIVMKSTKRSQIIEFIQTKFDFDICQNYYWINDLKYPQLILQSVDNLFHRKLSVNPPFTDDQKRPLLLYRVSKYRQHPRSFTVANAEQAIKYYGEKEWTIIDAEILKIAPTTISLRIDRSDDLLKTKFFNYVEVINQSVRYIDVKLKSNLVTVQEKTWLCYSRETHTNDSCSCVTNFDLHFDPHLSCNCRKEVCQHQIPQQFICYDCPIKIMMGDQTVHLHLPETIAIRVI